MRRNASRAGGYSTPLSRWPSNGVPSSRVSIERGTALVPAELLKAGGARKRVCLQAVSGPRFRLLTAEGGAVEAGGGGARLDDPGDRARIDDRARGGRSAAHPGRAGVSRGGGTGHLR